MQNQAIQTQLPAFNNRYYGGLAGLLSNPAYLARAEQVNGKIDPYAASVLQSCAETAINSFGDIQAVFSKLVLANTEARTNRVCEREIADAQFQLGVMLGEVQPLLAYINNILLSQFPQSVLAPVGCVTSYRACGGFRCPPRGAGRSGSKARWRG